MLGWGGGCLCDEFYLTGVVVDSSTGYNRLTVDRQKVQVRRWVDVILCSTTGVSGRYFGVNFVTSVAYEKPYKRTPEEKND